MMLDKKFIKENLFFGTFIVFLILISSLALATITFIAVEDGPSATGETMTGNVNINVTTDIANATNCSFSTTANANFVTAINDTLEQSMFNVTQFDTTSLTNAEDTTLTANCCGNDTLVECESGTLTVNVDNTVPTCSFSFPTGDHVKYLDAIGLSPSDASSDTTDLTYAWCLADPNLASQQTSTSSAPTFSGTDFGEIGTFTLGLTITDEANLSTECTNLSVFVTGTDDKAQKAIATTSLLQPTESKRTVVFVVLGFILLIAIVVIVWFFTSKSKKR